MVYFLYILECVDGSLYTGITTDLARRFAEHQEGIGSRYTRAHGALRMRYAEECADRGAASKREAEVKRLSRKEKEALISSSGA